jgi:hypothetical protein
VSSVSSVSPEGTSPEQERQIQRLVREGMSESIAREEVLGKGWVDL